MCEWNKQVVVELPAFMWIELTRKNISLDLCIIPEIKALWDVGIPTRGCCCGHGKDLPSVIISSGARDGQIQLAVQILEKMDKRRWFVLQWRLNTVGATFPK